MKNDSKPGNVIQCTAPEGGVTSGTPVLIGSLFGVPAKSASAGDAFPLVVEGVVELAKATPLAISEGDNLYWNAGTGKVTKTTSDTFIGGAASAAGSSATEVSVKLVPYPGTADAAGAVMESDYNAHTILAATVDNAPQPLTVAEDRIVGRASGGNIAALTPAQVRAMLNVEDGADVTDAENVDAAGAVMESDYNAHTILAATANDTPLPLTVGEDRIVGRASGGNIAALTPAEVRTMVNVEDGADVTDAENVGAAAQALLLPEHVAILTELDAGLPPAGLPFVMEINVEAASGTIGVFDSDAPFKFQIIDAWALCTAANANGTAKLNSTFVGDGTDITSAMVMAVEHAVGRTTVLHKTARVIDAGGSLSVIKNAAGDDGIVYVSAVRVA